MKEASKYDLVVKDLFQQDHPSLLDKLTGGVAVRQVLNVELARVEERRADLVLLLEDETILHLEFQSRNDKQMPYREGIYCLLLGQKYRRRVRQVVIYLGQPKMRMQSFLDLGQTQVSFTLLDIRQLDARELMASGRPGDLALAMLAGGGQELLVEILQKATSLEGSDRQRALTQITMLSGLRVLPGRLIMETKAMFRSTDPFYKNPFVVEFMRMKVADVLREQLKLKFRRLPKWADKRLDSATAAEIDSFARKIITAETLVEVVGKR